jgi:hypothetical protein
VSDASYRKIFSEVCSQEVEDNALTFLPDTIRVQRIGREFECCWKHVPLQIEVGLGDAIVPASEELEYPPLLKFPAPKLHAYSKESVVAESSKAWSNRAWRTAE